MKHNKFVKILEMILVSLPLIYVGGVGAYTIFNKNAKDSYSDSYVSSLSVVNNSTLLQENNLYYIDVPSFIDDTLGSYNQGYNFYVSDTNYNLKDLFGYSGSLDIVGFYARSYNTFVIFGGRLSDDNFVTFYSNSSNLNTTQRDFINGLFYFTFNGIAPSVPNANISIDYNLNTLFLISYKYNTLTGALPYAMNEFNKLGFGKVDFVSWFTNIFMTENTNNVYVTFVNSYLNYFIMVETIYFLPMVLYWFIHFGESVITHFANKEYWK